MTHILRYWKTLVVGGGILYLSLMRNPHIQMPSFEGSDKWAHIGMYVLLAGVLMWELLQNNVKKWHNLLIAFILPVLYGGIIEVLQENFFPPRSGDWWDWTADIAGTILGVLITSLLWKTHHSSI